MLRLDSTHYHYLILHRAPPYTVYLYHGEKCTLGSQCITGSCLDGFCVGYAWEEPCNSTTQCANGLYCSNSSATPMCDFTGGAGDTCSYEVPCSTGYECVESLVILDPPTCVKYFSLPDYTTVTECNLNSNILCMSGQCATAANQTNYCVPLTKNKKSTPTLCTSDNDCITNVISRVGTPSESYCSCGYSTKGNAHCFLFPGDNYPAKAISSHKLWTESTAYSNCNVEVEDYDCAASQWTSNSERSKFQYYRFMAAHMIAMVEADTCAVAIFYPNYAAIKSAYDKYGAASILALSILVLNLLT